MIAYYVDTHIDNNVYPLLLKVCLSFCIQNYLHHGGLLFVEYYI